MTDQLDFPFDEVVREADKRIRCGFILHQKFSCFRCGNRLTIEAPNTFHERGTCDVCHATTDIRKRGCNYLMVASREQVSA